MGFKMPSNRRLSPQNSKVVNTAIDTIKTTAKISQEKYWNALKVDGHSCFIYNRRMQGRVCSCTLIRKRSDDEALLDESGNASQEFIQNLLGNGQGFGIEQYGSERNKETEGPDVRTFDVENAEPLDAQTGDFLEDTQADFIEENYTEDTLENDIDIDTTKCAVCFGSGFVGGYSFAGGQRYVLDSTHYDKTLYGFSINELHAPHTFNSTGSAEAYVDFIVTLPKSVSYISALQVWHNTQKVEAEILFSHDGETFDPQNNVLNYFTGLPITVRIKGVEDFTHLELQFAVSQNEYLIDYPKHTRMSDLSLLDAYTDVQLMLSPNVIDIRPWDIVCDNTRDLYWQVKEITDHKDRNLNIYGWEVSARLLQKYELKKLLPSDKTSQVTLTPNFKRY